MYFFQFSGAPHGGGPHGMPSHHPPTTSAAAQMNALTSAQHYAALTQQYHAAAAMQAFTGSNPMAAQAQAAQLLAQYQQSLATSLTPDMILQQYPHLKAAGLAAPPHMLGRNPATEHMHMLQAREREVQMERERQSRWEISSLILGISGFTEPSLISKKKTWWFNYLLKNSLCVDF